MRRRELEDKVRKLEIEVEWLRYQRALGSLSSLFSAPDGSKELWYKTVEKKGPEPEVFVEDWSEGVKVEAGLGWRQIPGSRFEIKAELFDPLGVFHIRKRPKNG